MTATTKEQREALRRIRTGPHNGEELNLVLGSVPALLADYDLLSAKVAEQEGEIERLKQALPGFYEAGDITMNKAGCDWVDDLMQKARDAKRRSDECEAQWAAWQQKEAEALIRAETAEATVADLRSEVRSLTVRKAGWEKVAHNRLQELAAAIDRAEAAEAERDTLRRLLTETAVPALSDGIDEFCEAAGHGTSGRIRERALSALSTIRAHMAAGNKSADTATDRTVCPRCDGAGTVPRGPILCTTCDHAVGHPDNCACNHGKPSHYKTCSDWEPISAEHKEARDA